MSVHLQRIRFLTTTKDEKGAGTDDGVDLWYHVNNHLWTTLRPLGWYAEELNHKLNDRERGRTDMYELDFRRGVGVSVSGTSVPQGIAFNDFTHARTGSFWLRMKGKDWWKLDHYYLLGDFRELRHLPDTIDSFNNIHYGWLMMARREGDVEMSTDPSEGQTWHHIELNGTFF